MISNSWNLFLKFIIKLKINEHQNDNHGQHRYGNHLKDFNLKVGSCNTYTNIIILVDTNSNSNDYRFVMIIITIVS